MRNWGVVALTLCAWVTATNAVEWKGDYKKITGDETRLSSDDGYCGGTARIACVNDNCELRVRDSRCDVAELYLSAEGNTFLRNPRSYQTKLIFTGGGRYSGNIYLDLRRASTVDKGFAWEWKKYWINVTLHQSMDGRYENICPNFQAKDLRF